MSMSAQAKTQDIGGKVIDENGQPLPYVNVVLLSLPDSAFVQGAMTDEQGIFNIVTNQSQGLLKLSSVGYETLYLEYKAANGLTIQMKEDTKMLTEVVVKGQLPKTHVKGDAMRTTIAGTILENAGTVSDALGKIPSLETERGGSVKVLGRGEAEVYINGRRVQDLNELSRLRSDQIQHIDVVQNPGARYAASTKAVVRITLKKAQGEGFSFQDYVDGMYQYGHTLTNNLDVNYRTGGLDITASLWAGRYGHYKSMQEHELTYFVGPDYIESNTSQESKGIWKGWSPQLQLNYMVNENHSFGAFYKYDRHPSSDYNGMIFTDNYENGQFTEHSESRVWQDETISKHIFNAYYNGKIGQLGIDLNVDGLFDDTKTPGSTTETTKDATGGTTQRSFESGTNSGNNFWASKLIFSYPVWKGNLSVGGEYSYNHRTDAYSFTATDYVPVKTTDTEINEKSSAAFVEYGRSFGKVFAQVGLRYEHLTNDYFNFGKKEDEVCRDYGDWFPTAVISAPIGKAQLSFSYRRDIQRPNYANLTSSTVYVNRYTYQSGNPYLLPTYTHSLVFNAAYKWANLALNYGRVKDALTMSTEPFPGSEDPLVSLVRPINSWEDYNQFSFQVSARPVIGCWHPMWTVITQLQDFKSPTVNGSTITLNHPWFIIGWQNDIELPQGFRLNVSAQWYSKGDYNNFRMTKTRLFTNVGLQRDFNLKRMGTLTFDLRCSDPFHTNKTDAIVYGYRELTTHNPARRTFVLDITWKFNEARSKYRGSGAGEKQKARM
ncbi:outer membrane beta-barrel protein [Segatella bryantii]|uniref:outer membrane beta-barrel protein n=1 Tax=Segatella bryantii TaxID=77095 RepID=UPI001ED9EEDA|nr:outer membrane beta-barrel protein [Segatella bryantii]UKK71926.1 outer membrane beta-barrel protein [Segatella bryantii]